MKNLFSLLFVLFVCNLSSYGQAAEREMYLNPNQIEGVCNLGDYGAVVAYETYRALDDKDLFTLHYLDSNLPTQTLVLSQGSKLVSYTGAGAKGAITFRDGPKMVMVTVSPDLAAIYSPIPVKSMHRYGNPKTDMDLQGNALLVRQYYIYKIDAAGREVIIERGTEYYTIDDNGAIINERSQKYELAHPTSMVALFPTEKGVAYHMESFSKKKKRYVSKMVFCDNNGAVVGEYDLRVGEMMLFPSDVIFDNGNYVLSGDYMKGNFFEKNKAEGLFMAMLSETGAEQTRNMYAWDNLKESLKDSKRGDFILSGRMRVMVEKIVNNGSGYTILGESFYKGRGLTGAKLVLGDDSSDLMITVQDFVLFDTDANGNLTAVNILEKEPCNIEMVGLSKGLRAVHMARLLKRSKVFPFKGMTDGVIDFVNYKAGTGALAQMDVATGAITDGTLINLDIVVEEVVDIDGEAAIANSNFLSTMDGVSKDADKLDQKLQEKGGKLAYAIDKVDRSYNIRGYSDQGLFFLTTGNVLSYEISLEHYSVFYSYLK